MADASAKMVSSFSETLERCAAGSGRGGVAGRGLMNGFTVAICRWKNAAPFRGRGV
jgi:hypothetical protein